MDKASLAILPLLVLLFLPAALAQTEHDQLYTVCSMRIIVDQWVLKDQNADKNVMSLIVHNHINSLNVIYEKNVRYKGRQLRFTIKDGDLQFRDAEWCRKNPDSVSCMNPSFWKDRTPTDFLKFQKIEAGSRNSDVCLVYHFISHTFRFGHEGTIGLAYVDRLCKGRVGANMGFVLFKADKTNQDDKNIETNFIFAHEDWSEVRKALQKSDGATVVTLFPNQQHATLPM